MAHAASKDPNVFLLPDLGEGLAEAELLKWRVEVGQEVGELEIIAEMETDKAVVEVTSPRAGKITALHGKAGDVIKVGTPLVEYDGEGAARSTGKSPASSKSAASNGTHAEVKPGPALHGDVLDEPPARTEDAGTVVGMMSAGSGKALATPAVRRLARDLGVDIDAVAGTGIGGRVMEKDVRACSGAGSSGGGKAGCGMGEPSIAPRAAGKPPKGGHSDVAPMDPEEPHSGAQDELSVAAKPRPASATSPRAPSRPAAALPSSGDSDITRIPFRGVRRTIATRLRESMNQAVHFTVMDEADVSGLDSLRRKLAAASGEKVSFLPFVAGAVCRVLSDSRFRSLNATVDEKPGGDGETFIVQHRSVHLGIATDTENGLMVPVIRDSDRLGVLEIGRAISGIAESARNRSIPRDQLMGSTFTISNVGSHAGRFATPVINYPEVGILAVGRGREGMVVNKGSFRVGLLLPLSLACDHRVVDGATAALALAEIIALLARPEDLLGPARD